MEISRQTYIEADDNTRAGLQYDLISGLYSHDAKQSVVCAEQVVQCDKRFKKLEIFWAKAGGVLIIIIFVIPPLFSWAAKRFLP